MGGTQSKKKVSNERFKKELDQIAADYIFTLNYTDLRDLAKDKYCDKLVILTTKIFEQKLQHTHTITYLEQKMSGDENISKTKTEKILTLKPGDIKQFDIKKGAGFQRKKRLCIGLAEFYVKIGHLFSAIYHTLNIPAPQDRNRIVARNPVGRIGPLHPSGKAKRKGFCSRRYTALKPHHVHAGQFEVGICSVNKGGENVADLVGMPSLRDLYVDVYNYGQHAKNEGKFIDMSSSAKKDFKNDLYTFYRAFTGKSTVPPHINDFSDIKLKDYADTSSCAEKDAHGAGLRRSKFNYDPKDPLFAEYGRHLAQMLNTAHTTQNKLLDVLNVIFKKKEGRWTINPNLTQKKLDEQVRKTRKIIVNLYSRCEEDFRKGVKLFDAITASKDFEKYTRRKENLKHQEAKFVAGQPRLFKGEEQYQKERLTQAQTRYREIRKKTQPGVFPAPKRFYKASKFLGKVPGYAFRHGSLGQGYYKDTTIGPPVQRGIAFIPGPVAGAPVHPPRVDGRGYVYRIGPQGLGYYLDNPQGLVGGIGAKTGTVFGSGWGSGRAPIGGRRR